MTKPVLDYSNFSLSELESILDVAMSNYTILVAAGAQRLESARRIYDLQEAINRAKSENRN